jgi:hypothetical protein
MSRKRNYFLLSGLFFLVFLVLEFTDIYGDSGWFKAFVLILFITFLISGIAIKKKKNNDNEQPNE